MSVLLSIASLAVYSYSRYLDKAKQTKARTDISTFVDSIDHFYGDKGRYPDNSEGGRAITIDGDSRFDIQLVRP